jgi:hypothetical protein
MRFLFSFVGVLLLVPQVVAETPSLRTKAVLATYRLEHPKTSGTAFVISRPHPADARAIQLLLVTAAHAFEKMDGEQVTLVLRKRQSNGGWVATAVKTRIRQDGKPIWHQHPKHDVAVLRLATLKNADVDSIPLDTLANAEDWKVSTPEPGSLVRCVGFPHAAQFKPDNVGFPMTRLGCVASYPLTPYERHATFLVDYNSFEGDSGGVVYSEEFDGSAKIIGLVHGQHFLDERYKLVYQQGMIRKRLGLAIIVNSQAVLETIDGLPDHGE